MIVSTVLGMKPCGERGPSYVTDTPRDGAFFRGSGRLVCLTLDACGDSKRTVLKAQQGASYKDP